MSDEELTKLMDSMQDKLGAENSALIADDLGVLISGNAAYSKIFERTKMKKLHACTQRRSHSRKR